MNYYKSRVTYLEKKMKGEHDPMAILNVMINNYDDLIAAFNQFFCVDINLRSRKREVVIARQMYYRFMKNATDLSIQFIAKTLACGHDHSTVLHSLQEFDYKYEVEKKYRQQWNRLISFLEAKFPEFKETLEVEPERMILDPAI